MPVRWFRRYGCVFSWRNFSASCIIAFLARKNEVTCILLFPLRVISRAMPG